VIGEREAIPLEELDEEMADLADQVMANKERAALATAQRDELSGPDPATEQRLRDMQVEDEIQASRFMRLCVASEAELARAEAIAEAEKRQVDTWLESRRARIIPTLRWFLVKLELFMRRRRDERQQRLKSMDLPHGRIGLTAQRPAWDWDEKAAVAWLQGAEGHLGNNYLRTKVIVELDKEAIRRDATVGLDGTVTLGGARLLGVSVRPAEEPKFYWQVAGREGKRTYRDLRLESDRSSEPGRETEDVAVG